MKRELATVKPRNLSGGEIYKLYEKANGIKQNWDVNYNRVYEMFMPEKNLYDKDTKDDTSKPNQLYTSLGQECAMENVNKMKSLMFPINADIMDLEAGAWFKMLAEEKGVDISVVNQELAKINRIANEIRVNKSNFDEAVTQCGYDIFVGTGCLMITAGTRDVPVNCVAIPLPQFCILEEESGNVSHVFRKFELEPEQVPYMWKDADIFIEEKDKQKKLCLLECSCLDPQTRTYSYYVITMDKKEIVIDRHGFNNNPFQVIRVNKPSGEFYGKGVGYIYLNDMIVYNDLVRAKAQASAFEVPMFEGVNDGAIDVSDVTLEGGSLLMMPPTESGEQRIRQIQVSTNMPQSQLSMQELEMRIRRGTLADTIPDSVIGRNKTATEIEEIARSLKKNIGASLSSLVVWQQGIVKRFYEVLMDVGYLRNDIKENMIDTDKIDGLWFACVLNTPLSKQIAIDQTMTELQFISYIMQLDPSGQLLSKCIKVNEYTLAKLDQAGISREYLFTPEEVAQNEKALGEAMQQQQMQQVQLDVEASNAKERGKEVAKLG